MPDVPLKPAELFDLSGDVAFVTGASRGIGFAIARALGGAGAHVMLNARDAHALDVAHRALESEGISCECAAFDAADLETAEHAITDLTARRGRLDILVSNAAATVRKPLFDQTEADWQRVIDVSLTATWRIARAAARIMIPAKHGRILAISSINAVIARPTITPYVAAKAGLEGLVRALAVELAPSGVTVNAIAPGYMLTDGNAATRRDNPDFQARMAARIPTGRWGEAHEIGAAALYLCSRAANFTTGTTLTVDGGMTAAI